MKHYKQETPYSCGASALRNCIIKLSGKELSERVVRLRCNTTKDGTDARDIVKGAMTLGYAGTTLTEANADKFIKVLREGLKKNSVYVVLVDNTTHWIALIGYDKKYFCIVDSQCKRTMTKFTEKQFAKLTKNFDRVDRTEYFFAVEIFKP